MRANGFDDFEGLAKIALRLANELGFECAEIDAQQWNAPGGGDCFCGQAFAAAGHANK